MPWMETCVMDERMRFIVALLNGAENFSELCRHFGISRKTGYKWRERHAAEGPEGLVDRSRAPRGNGRAVAAARIERIVALRGDHPSWGPRKLKAWLEAREAAADWPSASTIDRILRAHGLTRRRKRRQRVPPHLGPFRACRAANDLWCIDFKGWFRTGDGAAVTPLTLGDAHSRYCLCLEAVDRGDEAHVWPLLEAAFEAHGLSRAIRSDNGPPFASRGVAGLCGLQVKLIKAGVHPERIKAGKPQQNGRQERFHRTLKEDACSPPAETLARQRERFRRFREIYNNERPHEALGQIPPARLWRPSPRPYRGLKSPEYDGDVERRRVRRNGEIKWRGNSLFIARPLAGEPVALARIGEDTWLVTFAHIPLGTIKGRDGLKRLGKTDGGLVDKPDGLPTTPPPQQQQD